jgi:hypothetical protein
VRGMVWLHILLGRKKKPSTNGKRINEWGMPGADVSRRLPIFQPLCTRMRESRLVMFIRCGMTRKGERAPAEGLEVEPLVVAVCERSGLDARKLLASRVYEDRVVKRCPS